MSLSFLAASDAITCTTSALDDAVALVGTERGTLMAFELFATRGGDTAPKAKHSGGPNSSESSGVEVWRLVASHATHARAIRSVAVCGVSWLVATASDDASVVLQPLPLLLCGGMQQHPTFTNTTLHHRPAHSSSDSDRTTSSSLPPTYPMRLRGIHTLPISHAAWVPGKSELITSSFDGHIAVYCASSHAVVNRVNVGFPLSTFCICSADPGVVFAAGSGMARVDLLEGSRIPLHGALTTQLALFSHHHVRPESTNKIKPAAVAGVERMRWSDSIDEVNTRQDVSEEEWATERCRYASQATYNDDLHAVTMLVDLCAGRGSKLFTWKLRSQRWKIAEAPCSVPGTQAVVAINSIVARRLQQAHIVNIAPSDSLTNKGRSHNLTQSTTQSLTSKWSLGFSNWYKPNALPLHIEAEVRLLEDTHPSSRGTGSNQRMVSITDRKRMRQELDETKQSRELSMLRTKMLVAQQQCDDLAGRLKDALVKSQDS